METKNKLRRGFKTNDSIKKSISIVLPVFNEKDVIKVVVNQLNALLNKNFNDYEIVIVESGSTDGTKEIVNELSRMNKHVKAIHQSKKEGLGSGLIEGFKNCNKNIIFYMDSDMPFDLKYILDAYPLIKKYDSVIGYKLGKRENIIRKIYSLFYNFLIRLIFNLKVKDVNFSFKMFRKEIIKDLHLISKGWFIDAEILIELKKHKCSLYQIAIPYKPRITGSSKVKIGLKTITGILVEMFNYIKNSH